MGVRWQDLLSHDHVKLTLNVRAHAGCHSGGQLVLGILECVNHLLQLANHRIPRFLVPLLPVFDVGFQLLDVCRGM